MFKSHNLNKKSFINNIFTEISKQVNFKVSPEVIQAFIKGFIEVHGTPPSEAVINNYKEVCSYSVEDGSPDIGTDVKAAYKAGKDNGELRQDWLRDLQNES